MDVLAALGSGLLAGFGIAAPLGAIAVLLIGEGVSRGFRAGSPGALAVGLVDTLYCAAAVTVGAVAAPVIAGWGKVPGILGGIALIALAVIGIVRSRAGSASGETGSAPVGSGWQRFVVFLGLTAINPATVIYFVALTAGLAPLLQSALTAGTFVAGVGIASISWQLALVAAGGLLRGRTTARARRLTTLAGNLIVAGLGVALLVSAAR